MKALIIDGNANFLYGLEMKFTICGLDISTNDGTGILENLLQMLRINRFDFIVSDLAFPEFDGLTLIRRIKEEPEIRQTPVFIYTSTEFEPVKNKLVELGIKYFFNKDQIGFDDFVFKINKIMENLEKINRLKFLSRR